MIREVGWYWVRYGIHSSWECAEFGENERWTFHNRDDRTDNYFVVIGPKIKEPGDEWGDKVQP